VFAGWLPIAGQSRDAAYCRAVFPADALLHSVRDLDCRHSILKEGQPGN